jgi:sodium transport system permease protein
MNWDNIKLIWQREMRDQLRDRRTLFVIGVLPLLIYPMMGIAFSRLSQFVRQNTATVAVVGYEQLDSVQNLPALLEDGGFSKKLFEITGLSDRMKVQQIKASEIALASEKERMRSGKTDVVVYFPPGFADRLKEMQRAMREPGEFESGEPLPNPPNPVVYYDIRDQSQLANSRVQILLDRWQSQIVRSNLIAGRIPIEITRPFRVEEENIATVSGKQAAFWAKLLPFIVFICALTGAFYPAVDLCAGEKERGTLETLLTSPAQRSEIVGGKLLTVITFSIGSAVCNLASMAITGQLIIKQINAMGVVGQEPLAAPSLASIAWLLAALLPMAVLFSATSLALASLARSTKEGQYYLMPLFLVCMPLMMLPLMPGIELNLPTSLVPISGMVLLMQSAMEGKLGEVALYALPVAIVTFGCCAAAVRWAVDQFNQESVLFRDTENFDLVTWIRYAYRHRPEVPKLPAAAILIALIFMAQFFAQSLSVDLTAADGLIKMVLYSQLFCILAPTLLVAWLASRNWKKTFLLANRVSAIGLLNILICFALAVAMQPIGTALTELLDRIVPLPASFGEMTKMLQESGNDVEFSIWTILLLMAVLPAICEELAFRGVVLSGLRSRLSPFWAVVISAIFFGLAHPSALQQTISAGILGLLLGFIAIKTQQITACVAFHMGYNGLQLLRTSFADSLKDQPWADAVFRTSPAEAVQLGYTTPVVILGGVTALVLLALLWQVGPSKNRSAETYGLQEDARSLMPSAAPKEQSRP